MPEIHGRCYCGKVRFVLTAPLHALGYCHCHICQQLSGSPMMLWAIVTRKAR